MATSVVQIVNSALQKIHEDPIASLEDDRRAARIATTQYPIHRDQLLRRYRWKFAVARVVLAPDVEAPKFGFTKRFLRPADLLSVIGIYDPQDETRDINYTAGRIPYKVEGRYILCNETILNLYYVRQQTDVTQFDSLFSEALAWSLAVDFALSLANSQARADSARGALAQAIRDARLADAIEGAPEVMVASTWLDSRRDSDDGWWGRQGPVL